ncbi:hypothetical protein FJZ19_03630 [Candidatus Pacearchaeota archaeon]|nr:hypothetical protein [Candidatus Pacearchaeota archaeon]
MKTNLETRTRAADLPLRREPNLSDHGTEDLCPCHTVKCARCTTGLYDSSYRACDVYIKLMLVGE